MENLDGSDCPAIATTMQASIAEHAREVGAEPVPEDPWMMTEDLRKENVKVTLTKDREYL